MMEQISFEELNNISEDDKNDNTIAEEKGNALARTK